jgi:hypothetical protein
LKARRKFGFRLHQLKAIFFVEPLYFLTRILTAFDKSVLACGESGTGGSSSGNLRLMLKRGFPSTHYFAQARVVFAVAQHRCAELFDPPGCMTLWHLPPELEDQFEERWQTWLDDAEQWTPFFEDLAGLQGDDLLDALKRFDLLSPEQFESARKLRRSLDGRAVPIPGTHLPGDDVITLLAAGFARGEPGHPAIPYARLEE